VALTRAVAASVLLCAARAHAQTYDASWHTVDSGGTAGASAGTLTLGGTIGQPDAGGPLSGGSFTLHAGFWATAGGGTPGPQADLGVTKTDGVTAVVPGQIVTYAIVVTNAGPSAAAGAAIADAPPAGLTAVSWTCSASAGSACPAAGSGAIAHTVDLASGGVLTYALQATVAAAAPGTIVNTASAAPPAGVADPDPSNDAATDTDAVVVPGTGVRGELARGSRVRADLASSGPLPDADLYRLRQQAHASYEIVLDEASGDVGDASGPSLDRVAADGATVLQPSQAAGAGPARSLRFMNTTGGVVDAEHIRVASAGCGTSCGPDDVYRLRAYDTTCAIPRFNNTASQVTVVVLQNTWTQPVSARVAFWSAAGALLHETAVALPARGSMALNASALPGLAGQGGSVTVMHDGPYGTLVGKGTALEPSTGFAFDSPLVPRGR
jgi:uncharacterized repeat protein (TIGR01451 family)